MKAGRTLWLAVSVLLLLHAMVVVGGVLWLWTSGRLNGERVGKVVEVFRPTLVREKEMEAEAKKVAEDAVEREAEMARLSQLGKGPLTPEDRLTTDQREDELLRQRLERLEREKQDLLRQIELAKDALTKQKGELDSQRESFNKELAEEVKRRGDRDFAMAVQMYEQLRPKQAKEMFQALMRQGKVEEVVGYLAAMQLRKSSAVLKEFKTGEEIGQVTELVQHLRKRGVDPLSSKPAIPETQGGEGGDQPGNAS